MLSAFSAQNKRCGCKQLHYTKGSLCSVCRTALSRLHHKSQWGSDQVQSNCKALIHEYNPRWLLFSPGLVQPYRLWAVFYPLSAFTLFQLHLTSQFQRDSDALDEAYAGKRFSEYEEVRKTCHAGYLSFESVRNLGLNLLHGTLSKYTLQGFHISMLHFLYHAVDGRSQ